MKLDLRPPVWQTSYRIIYADTDCGGVVYYGNYLRLFEIGRTEYLRAAGLTYRKIEEEEGLILPVVETFCRYRAPARYDDEVLIKTALERISAASIRFHYHIERDSQLLCFGYTVHAPVDQKGRLRRLPHFLIKALQQLLDRNHF
ncbi:acyl-CoA thioesterase [Thermosulfuriphilus sp.]